MELEQLKERMERIAGEWNGDLPGWQADRATLALDVIEKIKQINDLLKNL